MTLIYLYKYLNNILTKKVCYNAAYSFSCSNISFNREKTALQHSKHNEMSVKVTKQAMKMCHLYYRFGSTNLGTTEVQVHFWVETGMLLFFKFLRFIVDFKQF